MNDTRSKTITRQSSRTPLLLALIGCSLIGLSLALGLDGDTLIELNHAGSAPAGTVSLVGGVFLAAFAGAWSWRVHSRVADPAIIDPLTGLYRRGHGDRMVQARLAVDRLDDPLHMALVIMRLEHLDEIEARYGRAAVDELLRLFGAQIRGQIREGDLGVRYTPRQLAVYLYCHEIDQAQAFGRRIAMLLAAQQLDWNGDVIKVTAAMGIALHVPDETIEQFVARAEAKLTEAGDVSS